MRRAFIIGSNGPIEHEPLSYAVQDAENIRNILSQAHCGFEVISPSPNSDTFDIDRQLSSVVASCSEEDAFICYFSGHGVLEKGQLFLLLDNTNIDGIFSTALSVSKIIEALKYCKAQSKLLVLDCCHAGAVVNMLGLKSGTGVPVEELTIKPDNHLILMASDRLEKARELEKLRGSFLTANICSALSDKFNEADRDKDGRISMQDLRMWLEEKAKEHNQISQKDKVPYPYLFGQSKGDFFLATAISSSATQTESREESTQEALINYLELEADYHRCVNLPLPTRSNEFNSLSIPSLNEFNRASIGSLYCDLPLAITRNPILELQVEKVESFNADYDGQQVAKSNVSTDTSSGDPPAAPALLSAPRESTYRISSQLEPDVKLLVHGKAGCGKSTLLSFLAYHYAVRQLSERLQDRFSSEKWKISASQESLPNHSWFPVTLVCRYLTDAEIGNGLIGLIQDQLRLRYSTRYSKKHAQAFADFLEKQMSDGKVLLLIDGLDEIPTESRRRKFAQLIEVQASMYPHMPIIITSRPIGLEKIRASLNSFKYLKIAPIGDNDKKKFIQAWAHLTTNSDQNRSLITEKLERSVCGIGKLSKLSESVFLLTLIARICLQDKELPNQKVDVYRRAVQLMIGWQREGIEQSLIEEEIYPHIEHLAYCMHLAESNQLWIEPRVIETLEEVRRQEPRNHKLRRRNPEDWLNAVIEKLGLLSVVGKSDDERGDEWDVIEIFHPSFQEHFASQALLHCRGIYGSEPLDSLRQHVSDLTFDEQKIEALGSGQTTELVVAGKWEEVIRNCIEELSQRRNKQKASVDDMILLILSSKGVPTEKERALSAFALKCLADYEPDLREDTIEVVLDAAIDNINELDSFTSKPSTSMDEAFQAVRQSRFEQACRDRLIQSYIQTRDFRRLRIGCVLLTMLEHEVLSAENPTQASQALESILENLVSARSVEESVKAALRLTDTLFRAETRVIDSLPDVLLSKIVNVLLTTVKERTEGNEAVSTAAMWAMAWLVNENYGIPHMPYIFSEGEFDCLRQIIMDENRDVHTRRQAAYVLGACSSEKTVFTQTNWVYEWALIADGHKPHRQLPIVVPANRPKDIQALKYSISSDLPQKAKRTLAIALGRLGCFLPEIVEPLIQILEDDLSANYLIEEALVYLALIGGSRVTSFLTQKISYSENVTSSDRNLYELCLLGLVGMENLEIIKHQLELCTEEQTNLDAYAYVLAGVDNPKGQEILRNFEHHEKEKVRNAVTNALSKQNEWNSPENKHGKSSLSKDKSNVHLNRYIARRGDLVHKLKAKDSTGRWAYYFVFILPNVEPDFLKALDSTQSVDLEDYGKVIASCYGEQPNEEIKAFLKERFGFDV